MSFKQITDLAEYLWLFHRTCNAFHENATVIVLTQSAADVHDEIKIFVLYVRTNNILVIAEAVLLSIICKGITEVITN